MTPDLGRGTGVNQRVSRFSRRESPVPRRSGDWWHWLLLLTMTLLGFALRQDQREIFVLPTRDDFPAFRPKEWDFLPVIVLRDSDCLEFLWFARTVRLRLAESRVAPPLILLLSPWPWRTATTRSAELSIRNSGFEVIVSTARIGQLTPQHAAPSMVLVDRSRRVRAAFVLPTSPREMYDIIRAAKQLLSISDTYESSDSTHGAALR